MRQHSRTLAVADGTAISRGYGPRYPADKPAALRALQTVINYAWQQNLIPRPIEVEELFDTTTRGLGH
jgi:hypothetical protein